MTDRSFRCGFIAVVGRPNVGKSTLVNAILGHKISIVTPKPQTTRHRILAVDSRADCQLVFVDTPGLHRGARKAINRMMNRAAAGALADADVVLFVTEANRFTAEDADVLERLRSVSCPVIAVLNKIDRIQPKDTLLKLLDEMSKAGHAQFIIATHSPILLACPGASILSFDTNPVRQIEYENTDHYRIYKKFMKNPHKYIPAD